MRLGHANRERIGKLIKMGILTGFDLEEFPTCEACLSGKMTKLPFPKAMRSNEILEVVHSDICGPMSTRTRTAEEYFITFIDDKSRFGKVYLLHKKSEALEMFIKYKLEVL